MPCGLDHLVKFYQHEKLGRDLFKKKNLSIVLLSSLRVRIVAQSLLRFFKWALDLVGNLICGTQQVRLTSNGKESEEKTEQQCGELFDLAAGALRLENIFVRRH